MEGALLARLPLGPHSASYFAEDSHRRIMVSTSSRSPTQLSFRLALTDRRGCRDRTLVWPRVLVRSLRSSSVRSSRNDARARRRAIDLPLGDATIALGAVRPKRRVCRGSMIAL